MRGLVVSQPCTLSLPTIISNSFHHTIQIQKRRMLYHQAARPVAALPRSEEMLCATEVHGDFCSKLLSVCIRKDLDFRLRAARR